MGKSNNYKKVIYKNGPYEVKVNLLKSDLIEVLVIWVISYDKNVPKHIIKNIKTRKRFLTDYDGYVWYNPLTWWKKKYESYFADGHYVRSWNRGLHKTINKAIRIADSMKIKDRIEEEKKSLVVEEIESLSESNKEVQEAIGELDRLLTA